MKLAAGILALLTVHAIAGMPESAMAADESAHEHELAEKAPPSADIADQQAEAQRNDAHSSDTPSQKTVEENAPPQDVHTEEHKAAEEKKKQDSGTAHEAATEASKTPHEDDHTKQDAEAHGDEEHPSEETAGQETPSPLQLCYQAAAENEEHAPSQTEPDISEKDHSGNSVQKNDGIEEPYKLIRTLEIVQDKIATGSRNAHIYQRELIGEIARKLSLVPDTDWKTPKNSRAAILYALSGGDPKILQKLLTLGPLPCIDESLLKGLLAYSKGENESAKSQLLPIDARSLDSRVAAHLSLAQAMLIAAEAPKEAMGYLDFARLLAPGTLVEEAALRRAAVIAAVIEDFETFEMLTSQYLRRFSKSVYAPEFLSRFAVAVSSSKYASDEDRFQKLTQMFDGIGIEEQRSAYVAIIQAAIVRGRVTLTRAVARKLADFVNGEPELTLQAKLYEAAVTIVTEDYEQALAQLKSIDRARLPPRDQSLLDAALDIAERMRLPPQLDGPISEPPPVSAEQGKQIEFKLTPQLIDNAKTAIGQADDILNGDK